LITPATAAAVQMAAATAATTKRRRDETTEEPAAATATTEPITAPAPAFHPLRQELAEWAFMPEGVAAAFEEEARRMTALQSATNAMLDRVEALLGTGQRTLAGKNAAQIKHHELESLLRETRRVQTQFVEPALHDISAGLARVAENYRALYQKHRKFSRDMICHLQLQNGGGSATAADGKVSGIGLIRNPHVVV